MGRKRSGVKRSLKTVSTAAFTRFSAIWASRPSSSASISILPIIDAGSASRSLTRRSEEHTSELQSLMRISYAVFCLNKKTQHKPTDLQFRHITQQIIDQDEL